MRNSMEEGAGFARERPTFNVQRSTSNGRGEKKEDDARLQRCAKHYGQE